MGLALALRLLAAALRPVWVDEAASAIFTAGNSSWSTPINALASLPQFSTSLQLHPGTSLLEALRHLQQEDNHPPLHFGVAFVLARLLQPDQALLQPLVARLPAIVLGSLSVPLLHGAVHAVTGQRRAARIAAALAAVSPLAVAFGSEARHYALATSLVCAALWAMAAAWQHQQRGAAIPLRLQAGWLAMNGLGVLTHHLFVLCIAAQLLTLALLRGPRSLLRTPLLSLLLSAVLLRLLGSGGAMDQTAWLQLDPHQPIQVLLIPLQMLATALSGVLAPGTSLSAAWQWPLLVLAGLGTLVGAIALLQLGRQTRNLPPLLLSFCLCSMAMLLLASLATGKDLSRALRYGFLYLPGVLALVACSADQALARLSPLPLRLLLACSLCCSLGVAAGVALPASYNPTSLLDLIGKTARAPVVLAFNERPVTQGRPLIGYEGLSIAWQLGHDPARQQALVRQGQAPQLLLLLSDGQGPPAGLQSLASRRDPYELWIVNAHGTTALTPPSSCRLLSYGSAGGHLHIRYRCEPSPQRPLRQSPPRVSP